MGYIEDSISRSGIESREDVSHRKLLTVERNMGPALHYHGVRALLHLLYDPVPCPLCGRSSWDTRTERNLSSRVRERSVARKLSAVRFPVTSSSNYPERGRSEEHTSELQSHCNLVCRLLLEKT